MVMVHAKQEWELQKERKWDQSKLLERDFMKRVERKY